jgi:hypothetical protein
MIGRIAANLVFVVLWLTSYSQPVVGTIDLYGPELAPRHRILSTISVKEGDTLYWSTDVLKKKLVALDKVKAVSIDVVCCTEGKYNLFIGLDSTTLRSSSKNYNRNLQLPDTIQRLYGQYIGALQQAVAAGESEDDLSQGHSLMKSEKVRPIQQKFISVANRYFKELSAALLYSADAQQRAIAAVIVAYSNNKADVAKLYQKSLQDPEPSVRNNVLRALTGLAIYSQQLPEAKIVIPPSVFDSLLHSVYWTDRDKALFCLVALTEGREKNLLASLKKQALKPLLQMSQWRSKSHAFLAYIVLGRVVGVEDEEIFRSWQEGRQHVVLNAAGQEQKRTKR